MVRRLVSDLMRAPYPYFGGKSAVADVLWQAFGRDVPNFIDPFFGSMAVLLSRPGGPGKIETVNDKACQLANFWRAVKAAPEAVAEWCDRPVNECDMHAVHGWLVKRLAEIEPQLRADPDYFDAKVAGWWVWGMCAWVGDGWCKQVGNTKRPHIAGLGRGVNRTWHDRLPPWNTSDDQPTCLGWFNALSARMRGVRVTCGDWKRVLGPSVLGQGKWSGGRRPCAVLLDPPYDTSMRAGGIYHHDERGVAAEVRRWAIENGEDPDLRIALCGLEGEHAMPGSWTMHRWSAPRGHAGDSNDNRVREVIWFSRGCQAQASMF